MLRLVPAELREPPWHSAREWKVIVMIATAPRSRAC